MTVLIIFTAKYLIGLSLALFIGYALLMRRKRGFLKYALLVLVTSYLLALIAGFFYYDTRPFVNLGTSPLVAHAADNGFPSDHTLLAATLAAIVTPGNVPLGIVLWVIALLIGATRVLALVHYPIDIVASCVIAIVSAPLVWRLRLWRGPSAPF